MVTPSSKQHLWTRDEHLHTLTLDRLQLGELNPEEEDLVQQHLLTCAICRAEQQHLTDFDANLSLPPMPTLHTQPPKVIPFPKRWITTIGLLAAILIAALSFVFFDKNEQIQEDTIRYKGANSLDNNFTWTVFAKGDTETRELSTGDAVHPGERLGFQIHPRVQGHLLILGIDDAGHDYLCYPQRLGGHSRPMQASDEMISIDEAVRLDHVMGHERLVALYCEAPISQTEIRGRLMEGEGDAPLKRLREDCAQREILLYKRRVSQKPRSPDGTLP